SPIERRYQTSTQLKREKGATFLQVKSFNLQKTNVIEKGLGTLAIEYQFLSALKKYFSEVKLDLILYSTPPITFTKVIQFVKRRDNAYSYLLLKDIFPQNAIDMHLMKKDGFLHKLFLRKERQLYEASDTIGCMSISNKDYIKEHNPYLNPKKIEVNPNSIEPTKAEQQTNALKIAIRDKYNLPNNKMIFVYGGNLGLPQGINFLLQTIEKCCNQNVFFLIVGAGREYTTIEQWFVQNKPTNAKLLKSLPKGDYDSLVAACDVGMIFLNPDFTIPNFPSRLLSYLEFGMPVLAATDKSTDIGQVIDEAKCGLWVQSGDIKSMLNAINKLVENEDEFLTMTQNARNLLENKYTVDISYRLIVDKVIHHV
ncbi:MAG: glycosyltransferase family 4 protein, partial [Ginsengibacter sp.]